jgi:hypothetical protein
VTLTSFKGLYAELASLSHQEAPALEVNEDGSTGFSITVSGFPMVAMQPPRVSANSNTAFFFMDLGKMPEEIELAGWGALMQANYDLLNDGAPCFSRRPKTGEVLLQYAYPMDGGDPAALLGNLLDMVRIGREWRQEHFLGSEAGALEHASR